MSMTLLAIGVLVVVAIWGYFYAYTSDDTPISFNNEVDHGEPGNKPIWDWMEDRSTNMRDTGAKIDD